MTLAALLEEIRRRARISAAPNIDPWQAIRLRCNAAPDTLETRTLMRVIHAIREGNGDFDDADIWSLSQESLRLLDALMERKTGGS